MGVFFRRVRSFRHLRSTCLTGHYSDVMDDFGARESTNNFSRVLAIVRGDPTQGHVNRVDRGMRLSSSRSEGL